MIECVWVCRLQQMELNKETVQHSGKFVYVDSCQELSEIIDLCWLA